MEKQDAILEFEFEGEKFTTVPNEIVTDAKISPMARTLYMIIKHYITIPKFVLYKSTLKKAFGCGSDNTFDKYWKELKDLGLLVQARVHSDGRWVYKYKLTSSVKAYPNNWVHPKKQGVKKQGLKKQEGRKVDEYSNSNTNNTDLSNTDLSNVVDKEKSQREIYQEFGQRLEDVIDFNRSQYKNEREVFATDHVDELTPEFLGLVKDNFETSEIKVLTDLNGGDLFDLFDIYKGVRNLNGHVSKYNRIENPNGFVISEIKKKLNEGVTFGC